MVTRYLALSLFVSAALVAQQAPIPAADALGGRPFSITKTWVIGGVGNWDALTMDPSAGQLFIAHGPTVQVVDVATGNLAGTIGGFIEAHDVVLDDAGEFGYATDGPADKVRVFDRRTFKLVASIQTGPRPRGLVLEPQSGLLLAICAGGHLENEANPAASTSPRNPPPDRRRPRREDVPPPQTNSTITVIDAGTRKPLENLSLRGTLGLAEADGDGYVYVAIPDHNQVARLDVQAIAVQARAWQTSDAARQSESPPEFQPQLLRLPQECRNPRSVAVDGHHQRLFVPCSNMKMTVLNAATGESITSLTIGPGAEAIAYDATRGLVFTANGGGYGSITVIHQDVTDTYSVVQNLATRQQARTLAVNSSTGEVYLVTALYGAKLDHPPVNGIGTLRLNPVDSSFQVLVIGN